MTPEGRALLVEGAAAFGIVLTDAQLDQFERLYDLLIAGNARLNLTALKTERDIVLKHFVDSLSCLQSNALAEGVHLLDLGTGGGFPTLPLAILRPDLHITPVDATRKKIEFVKETVQSLGLKNVQPTVGRAETLGRQAEFRGQYDLVAARAVSALPILVELALPMLKMGGSLIAQKGPISEEELTAGRRAAAEVGGRVVEVEEFTLPVLGDARTLITVEKTSVTLERYPRRDGIPNQQPLFWKAKD